jgi:hypothetical protein
MATYYGYQEREDPTKSMIDWAGITKDITDGIYAENKRREEEKFTLDENIKQLNELNEYSQGLNPSVNQAMLGYIQNYRDYLLQNHKMMKQGIISVNDSKLAKQGAQDSFNNLNNVVKGVNGKLEELQKAGGALNDDQMKDLTQLMEFKDQQLLIDPKTGMASLARRNEDGTVDKNSIVPVGAAYQMFTPYEQKSVNDMVQGEIKGLAQWTEADSPYKSISDLRDNKDYKGWMDGTLEAMMADQRTTASLGASLGLLKSGELVKKNSGGVITYELTDTGKGKVKEALRQAIEVRVDREVKMKESLKDKPAPLNDQKAVQVYNEAIRLARFDKDAMEKLKGQVIDKKVVGNVDKNGNNLVIYDTEGNLIRQYNINSDNEDRIAESLALLVRPDAQSADTQQLFVRGRELGYSGGEVKVAESSQDYVNILETAPINEDEFVRFLENQPEFKNSNLKIETQGAGIDRVKISTKQDDDLGSYNTDDPLQRKQLFDKLKELGLNFPEVLRPKGLVVSEERFPQPDKTPEQDNNTDPLTGGRER